MPKILRNNIVALIILAVTLVVGITIGVVATTNTKKNMEFNIGISYKADLYVQITLGEEILFNSQTPSLATSNYISCITTDTIKLKQDLFAGDVTEITLTVTNLHSDKTIIVTANSEDKYTIAENGNQDIKIQKGSLGETLISLQFEEKTLPEFLKVYELSTVNSSNTVMYDASNTYNYCVRIGNLGDYQFEWVVVAGNLLSNSVSYTDDVSGTYNSYSETGQVLFISGTQDTTTGFLTAGDRTKAPTANKTWAYYQNQMWISSITAVNGNYWHPAEQILVLSRYLLPDSVRFNSATNGQYWNNSDATAYVDDTMGMAKQVYDATYSIISTCDGIDDHLAQTYIAKTAIAGQTLKQRPGKASIFLLGGDRIDYVTSANQPNDDSFKVSTYLTSTDARKSYKVSSAGVVSSNANYWWLRSGSYTGSDYAMCVRSDGLVSYSDVTDGSYVLRPAFVLNLAG